MASPSRLIETFLLEPVGLSFNPPHVRQIEREDAHEDD